MRFAHSRWFIIGVLMIPRMVAGDEPPVAEIVNPFEQSDNARVSASIGDESEEASPTSSTFPNISLPKPRLPEWKMPQMKLPEWKMPRFPLPNSPARNSRPTPSQSPRQPTVWEKFNTSTKSFFTKTRTTLMPWTADDGPPVRRSVTGSRVRTATRDREPTARKPLLPFLPTADSDPRKEIQSTTDFLSLPRPQYD